MPEAYLVTKADRAVPFGPQPAFRSGEIWTQVAFPCFSHLITMIGFSDEVGLPDHEIVYVMLNNPMHHVGMMPRSRELDDGTFGMFFTRDQLQTHLHELHYSCKGMLYEIIISNWHEALCREPPEES